jgi:hypothetical protein
MINAAGVLEYPRDGLNSDTPTTPHYPGRGALISNLLLERMHHSPHALPEKILQKMSKALPLRVVRKSSFELFAADRLTHEYGIGTVY